jgi:hypothetical protein
MSLAGIDSKLNLVAERVYGLSGRRASHAEEIRQKKVTEFVSANGMENILFMRRLHR